MFSYLRAASFAGALAAAGFTLTATAAPDVRPGLWETTVKTQVPGMPMAMPSITHRYCLHKKDLVPNTRQPGQHCKLLDHAISGNTVSWRVQCRSQGMSSTGEGKITYAGDTYHGRIVMDMQQGGGQPMKMIQTLQGRRVGDCK